MGTQSLNQTVQVLGIQLATNSAKKAVIATQADEDALNAAASPSSTNPVATHNDVDGTGADITPNSVSAGSTTDSTSGSTGAINTLGGLGVTKKIFAGTSVTTPLVSTDQVLAKTALGTTPVGTVTIKEYSTGRDVVTELTLTNFIVGALAGAGAALGIGNIVYTFPAGEHFELVYSFSSISLTCAGTAVNTATGLGSVIASGAVSVLSGTATFQDRLSAQTITTSPTGGTAVSALLAATAGIGTGISLNVAGSVKNVFLNSAGTWNANNTGNLTASGTIVLKWTKMG